MAPAFSQQLIIYESGTITELWIKGAFGSTRSFIFECKESTPLFSF